MSQFHMQSEMKHSSSDFIMLPYARKQFCVSRIVVPGVNWFLKYCRSKRCSDETEKKRVTEKELDNLNHKIDKLLAKIEDKDTDTTRKAVVVQNIATDSEEECVICMNAKATMQTYPCGHKVICRKCFIKTIQVAVSQRCLPLKCVICRTRILDIRQSSDIKLPTAKRSRTPLLIGGPRFGKHSKVYAK